MNSREWNKLDEAPKRSILELQAELPVKIGVLASVLGLEVKIATLDVGISGEIFPNGDGSYKIRINKHEIKERQRFTLAHEISHYLLHRDRIGDGVVDNILFRSKLSNDLEAEANRLAADILMPRHAIQEWRRQHPDVSKRDSVAPLAALFQVSEDAISIRIGIK